MSFERIYYSRRLIMVPAPKFSPQEQEELILDAAADCIWESSVLDFTMSAVSKAAGLSMGSVYKHVQSKEDIIIALSMRSFARQGEVFKEVLSLSLPTPEKIAGISLLSDEKVQVYPFDNELKSLAHNQAVLKRASPYWIERMFRACSDCELLFNKSMHKAAFNGELKLNGNTEQSIEEINLGCWAMMAGFDEVHAVTQVQSISEGTDNLSKGVETDSAMMQCLKRFVNSYQWREPLTDEGIVRVSEKLKELGFR